MDKKLEEKSMALTHFQNTLLRRIQNGETIFSPEGENMTIEQFQTAARAFIKLEALGYIVMSKNKKVTSGEEYIDRIYNCKIIG